MTHWRTFLDSDVIRFVDLGGKDHTVKIVKVAKGKVTGTGGKTNGKAMLYFEGKEKPYGAGTAVLSVIASLYSEDTRQWVGKWITIFPDPTVKNPSGGFGGVRVRPTVPKVEAAK